LRGQQHGHRKPAQVADAEVNAAAVLQRERTDDVEPKARPAALCRRLVEAVT